MTRLALTLCGLLLMAACAAPPSAPGRPAAEAPAPAGGGGGY